MSLVQTRQPGPLYPQDSRQLCGVLQRLQMLFETGLPAHDPSLADLCGLINQLQQTFGPEASLEGVIQALVAKDLERQCALRGRKRPESEDKSTSPGVPEGVAS